MHISRSSGCKDWIDREAANAGPLDPDDMETWSGDQSDSDFEESPPLLDESDWQMDIDELPPTPPPMSPSPPPPPLYPTSVNETSQGKVFTVNQYPHAAKIYDGQKVKTIYETIRNQEKDPLNPAFPFSPSEWNLAYWAGTSGLSNNEIDRFLNTPWVCHFILYNIFLTG